MILGVEASTSSAKALLYTKELGVIREKTLAYGQSIADVVSMDFEGVYSKLLTVIREVLEDDGHKVTDVAISTIWNSLVFLNEEMQPINRLMTWADISGDDEWLMNQQSDWSLTGCPKHYKFTRWKLSRSSAKQALEVGHKIGSLSDLLFFRMTGEWCISQMAASGSGLLNLTTGQWHGEVIDALSIKDDQLPPLVDWRYHSYINETTALELSLNKGVRIHVPNGDGGLNQYGEGGYDTDLISMSIGTSAAIRRMTKAPILEKGEVLWAHFLEEGYWVTGATFSGAGNLVDWFMKEINKEDVSFQQLEEWMTKLDIEGLPIFLPFMYGEQSPGWKKQGSFGYYGDQSEDRVEALYYSLLEGILFNVKQGYLALCDAYGQGRQILVSGGILNAPYWLKLGASILDSPLTVSNNQHSSLAGAVRLVSGDHLTTTGKEIVPDQTMTKILASRYKRYLKLYHKC